MKYIDLVVSRSHLNCESGPVFCAGLEIALEGHVIVFAEQNKMLLCDFSLCGTMICVELYQLFDLFVELHSVSNEGGPHQ